MALAEVVAEITFRINEAQTRRQVEQAVSGASPVAKVGVDEEHVGRGVSEAVEKAPPSVVPIETAGTAKRVEEGMIAADAEGAGKAVGGRFTNAFSAPMGALKGMVAGAIGFAAISGGTALFTSLITKGGEAAKAQKVLADAIRVTGGAANVSADDIEKMAGSQSRSTGVSRSAIEQSDALLLRFRNVRNEAGANNDIFNRTSNAALDLTAAFNKGTVTADGLARTTRVLGKAMEDPAKAAGVLRRYGVDLDSQQQAQIKTFLKSNDTLDAQKVILDAINKSYGGTAAATASGTAKMKAALDELEESVGRTLLPLFTSLIRALTVFLSALIPIADWFAKGGTTANILKYALLGLVGAISLYILTVKTVTAVTRAWELVQLALNAELALNPVGLVVVAIAALTIGIIELYKHSKLFRDLVHETWEFIRAVVIGSARALSHAFDGVRIAVQFLVKIWTAEFRILAAVTRAELAIITGIFRAAASLVTGIWRAEWALMSAIIRTAIGAIVATVRVFVDIIRGLFRLLFDVMTGNWRDAWQTIRTTGRAVAGDITRFLGGLGPLWGGAIRQAGNAMASGWRGAWSAMVGATRAGASAVSGAINIVRRAVLILPQALEAAARGVASAMEHLKNAVTGPADFITGKLGAIGRAAGGIGGLIGKIPGLNAGGPVAMAMENGGRILYGTGPRADDVLIRGSYGETMVSAAHSAHPVMRAAFQAVGVPGYQGGGIIGRAEGAISRVLGFTADQVDAAASKVLDLTSRALHMAQGALDQVATHQAEVGGAFGHLAGILSRTAQAAQGVLTNYSAQLGARRSYAGGGVIAEPVAGIGAYSRALYTFGESGREIVIPESTRPRTNRGGDPSAALLSRIASILEAHPAATAEALAQALNGVARSATAGATYSTRR